MEVTVKTLDSQTKTLNVSLETTVKEFKAKIAEEMNIPVEKQRLIFQGKVLQDEKPLQDYKVNGCVVHLVERQPPRTTRSNGQSTETTTSSTATTSSPGNMFMGAVAVPVDVMDVTHHIVQGIIQQMGAESAQANISTSASDDGSSVNVHINLSTIMSRNDARSRIVPARMHLNEVTRIIRTLQNGGLPSNGDFNEDSSNSERQTGTEGSESNNNNEMSLRDLADVLQEIVRLNDDMRPHLERYQELLRSGNDRELRPADDSLPDLTAEALHRLSHAYHALSDVTTNFRAQEPRLNVLPSMSPVPASVAHVRNMSSSNSQSQPSSTSQTSTGVPTAIPIGIGMRSGSGLGTGIDLRTGRGLGPGFSFRPGISFRPGSGMGATFGSRSGIPAGIGLIPNGAGLGSGLIGTPATSVPSSGTSATSTAPGSVPRPQNPLQNPLASLPVNLRNLPNVAVQFNPASGNITIAHIVTTVVEEPSLRTTTTTTNSTPSPRTSSWGSNPGSENQSTPTTQEGTPMAQDEPPTAPTGNQSSTENGVLPSSQSAPSSEVNSQESSMDTSQPPSTTSSSSGNHGNGQPPSGGEQDSERSREANAVLNFVSQNTGHRDPLLPCQSFHFASLTPSRGLSGNLGAARQQSRQPGDSSSQNPTSNGSVQGIPVDLTHLMNVSQQRAAEHRAAAASGANGAERNPFLELFMSSPQVHGTAVSADPADALMMHMASTLDEQRRTMTPEEIAEDRANIESQGTLSRFLYRLLDTIPMSQLLMTVVAGTGDPYTMSRSMTRDFLTEDILGGDEPTAENLQRATERILDELQKTFETFFASCKVKENIDAPATLLTYLRPKIRRLLEIINSSEPDSVYVTELSGLLTRLSAELFILTEYCLQDGRTGMENALRRSLATSPTISSLNPPLRDMAVDTMWSCVQDLRNSSSARESSLMPFVVRKEKRKAKKPESPSPPVERKEKKVEGSASKSPHAPRPSAGNTPSSSRRTTSSSQAEDTPMETNESWKRVIPAEWVPVISQDIIRQQRMSRQAPFSDGYLNGMPPKRRKIQQKSEPAPYNQCVSATLKRSITKAGVTPKTDLEKLDEEANTSESLERVFEDEVKSEVRKRLSTDTDYNSEKFPSIHKYFEKDDKNAS